MRSEAWSAVVSRCAIAAFWLLGGFGLLGAHAVTPGTVDTGFTNGGSVFVEYSALAAGLTDGKVLVAGAPYSDGARRSIIRLNSDGTLDTGFDAGAGLPTGSTARITAIAVQSDGKVLLGGNFTSFSGISRVGLIRLNPNGSVESEYNVNLVSGSNVTQLLIQPDGKLLVGGDIRLVAGMTGRPLVRLHPDGSLDNTFNAEALYSVYRGLALLPDGKILAVCSVRKGTGWEPGLFRLTQDGRLDATFQYSPPGGRVPYAIAVQPDGRIVLVGWQILERVLPDGAIDSSFAPPVAVAVDWNLSHVFLQADGKIVVGGGTNPPGNVTSTGVLRLNRDGSIDQSFTHAPRPNLHFMGMDQAGGVLVCGAGWAGPSYQSYVARLHGGEPPVTGSGQLQFAWSEYSMDEPDGSISLAVTRTGGNTGAITVDYVISGGTATAGNDFTAVNGKLSFASGETTKRIAIPIVNDGLIEADETFTVSLVNPAGGAALGSVTSTSVTIFDDEEPGRLEWQHATTSVNEGAGELIVQVTRNGEVFGEVSVNYAIVAGTADIQTDITGGNGTLTFASGEDRKSVIIPVTEDTLNEGPETFSVVLSDPTGGAVLEVASSLAVSIVDNDGPGSRIAGFETGEVQPSGNLCAVELPDGKLLVGGNFSSFGGVTQQALVRLNPDGSVDRDFVVQFPQFAAVFQILQQEDGKFLLRGTNLSTESGRRPDLLRLNGDGSVDQTFAPHANQGLVTAMALEPDGDIVVAGQFTGFGGGASLNLARLKPNGSQDAGFTVTGAPVPSVLLIQPDGRILVGGNFSNFAGRQVLGLVRIHPGGEFDEEFSADPSLRHFTTKVEALALQPDGKILAGGRFGSSSARQILVRLHPDGSRDPSFDAGPVGDVSTQIRSILVQANGRILVGGTFSRIGGIDCTGLARLHPDGSGDTSFAPDVNGGGPLLLLANGELLAGGTASNRPLSRLTAGDIDIAGQPGIVGFTWSAVGVGEEARQLVLQVARSGGNQESSQVEYRTEDGTAVAGRDYTAISGTLIFAPRETAKIVTVPVIDNGAIDGARNFSVLLSNPGSGTELGSISSVAVTVWDNERPGRLSFEGPIRLVRENAGLPEIKVVRTLGSEGAVTVHYQSVNGTATAGVDYSAVSGTLEFAAGELEKNIPIPVNIDGLVEGDETFTVQLSNPGGGAHLGGVSTVVVTINDIDDPGSLIENSLPAFPDRATIRAIQVQPDGKVLIAGGNLDAEHNGAAIIRTNADGSIDNSFTAPNLNGGIEAIGLQPDGKIIVGGGFLWFQSGQMHQNLVRLEANGSIDTSFVPPDPDHVVNAVGLQSDGRVIIGGSFQKIGAVNRAYLARLTSAGALDETFQPAAAVSHSVSRMLIDQQDRILFIASGPQLKRLLANGASDPDFNSGITAQFIHSFAADSDGRILVAGYLKATGGLERRNFVRLFPDGSVDPSFDTGTLFNDPAEVLAIQSDQRIIAAGYTQSKTRPGILRLNHDGSQDLSFQPLPSGTAHSHLNLMVVTPDHGVFVAGSLSRVDGVPQTILARLLVGPQPGMLSLTSNHGLTVSESSGEVSITVNRIGKTEGPVSVRYSVESGTAQRGEDFVDVSGTLTFADGVTSQTFSIPLLKDSIYELDEIFTIRLFEGSGGILLPPSAATLSVTLTSENAPKHGVVQFEQEKISVEEGAGKALLTVVRTGGSDEAITVNFSTMNGTAEGDRDFIAMSGLLQFAHGETTKQIVIPILTSQFSEPSEKFTVRLSDATGGAVLGTRNLATVKLTDQGGRSITSFKGSYAGLIDSGEAGNHGMLSLMVSPSGVATGFYWWDGKRQTFRGRFDGDGKLLIRTFLPGLGALDLSFQLGASEGGDQITGTLSVGATSYDLSAGRRRFNSQEPAPMAGRYTLLLTPDTLDSSVPIGSGYGLVTVAKNGTVRLAGTLPDGSKLSYSSSISEGGLWPLFLSLPKKVGIVAGIVQFTSGESWACDGEITWMRAVDGSSTSVAVSGSALPPSGQPLLTFTQGTLLLAGGDLDADITQIVTQVQPNQLSIDPGVEKVKLSLNAATGLLTGKFRHPATGRMITFKGAALPNQNRAAGYFRGPTTSGAVELSAP